MGRKNSILLGLFFLIIANVGIGTLYYLPDDQPILFICLMIIVRCLQGYGDSLTITTCFSLILQTFSTQKDIYVGYAEAAVGIGLTFGPAMGSLIYSYFGYEMVFYSFGMVSFIVLFICALCIPSSVNEIIQYED